MDARKRRLICLVAEKIRKYPEYARRIGIQDTTYFEKQRGIKQKG